MEAIRSLDVDMHSLIAVVLLSYRTYDRNFSRYTRQEAQLLQRDRATALV